MSTKNKQKAFMLCFMVIFGLCRNFKKMFLWVTIKRAGYLNISWVGNGSELRTVFKAQRKSVKGKYQQIMAILFFEKIT